MTLKNKNKPKLIAALFAALTLIECGNQKGGSSTSTGYVTVDMYCWCFSHDPIQELESGNFPNGYCNTLKGILPSTLIKQRNLFTSVTSTSEIEALQKTVFDEKRATEDIKHYYPDSRLLILFKKAEDDADTIVYSYPNELILNGKQILKYSFNVIDSVRRILGKDKIVCPD